MPDLIKICQEAQNVVNKQAEVLKGRKTIHPGPTADVIQQECTLELVGVKSGSTTLQFELAKPQIPFHFKDEFGSRVVAEVATTIRSLSRRKAQEIDPGLLLSVYELGGLVEGGNITGMRWITPKKNGFKGASVPITRTVREKAAVRLSRPRNVIAQVDGILHMADFKPLDMRCRIDPPIGSSIMCSFEGSLENQIYQLLRKPVRIKGGATLEPYSDRVDAVHIEEIHPLPSLELGEGNFFARPSIAELASIQDVKPLKDINVLKGGIPEDQDVDELLEDIYTTRKQA